MIVECLYDFFKEGLKADLFKLEDIAALAELLTELAARKKEEKSYEVDSE